MIVTFVDKNENSIHSCTDCEELHEQLVEGKALKIKGVDYIIAKIETRINGSIALIVHLS